MSEKQCNNSSQDTAVKTLAGKICQLDSWLGKCTGTLNSFFTPRRIIVFTLLFLLFHWFFSLCFNYQIYRDVAGVYAWYARDFGRGEGYSEVISKVPPLNIVLAAGMVYCGIESYAALICISMFFAMLTLIPLYRLLRNFVDEKIAAWGCLLFAFAPKSLRFYGTGLLESTRDFFLVSAICLLIRGWKNENRWYHWVLFGGALGLMSMARGEGAVMAAAAAAGLLVRPLADYRSVRAAGKKILLPLVLTCAAGLAVVSPAMIHNYKTIGYPVIDARQVSVIELIPGVRDWFKTPDKTVRAETRILPTAPEKIKSDSSWGEDNLERLQELVPKAFRGGYEIYMILVLTGIAVLLWQKKWRKEYTFLVVYCAAVSIVFVFYAVAHRYFIFYVPLLMIFTLTALSKLGEFAGKYKFRNLAFFGVGAVVVLQPFNAWSWMIDKEDHCEILVGKYIKENRLRFLPENEKDRKLIVHGDMRVVYYCDEDRLFDYGETDPRYQYATGFDVLLIRKKEKALLEACQARKDLEEIDSPVKEFVIFVPAKRQKNEQ